MISVFVEIVQWHRAQHIGAFVFHHESFDRFDPPWEVAPILVAGVDAPRIG